MGLVYIAPILSRSVFHAKQNRIYTTYDPPEIEGLGEICLIYFYPTIRNESPFICEVEEYKEARIDEIEEYTDADKDFCRQFDEKQWLYFLGAWKPWRSLGPRQAIERLRSTSRTYPKEAFLGAITTDDLINSFHRTSAERRITGVLGDAWLRLSAQRRNELIHGEIDYCKCEDLNRRNPEYYRLPEGRRDLRQTIRLYAEFVEGLLGRIPDQRIYDEDHQAYCNSTLRQIRNNAVHSGGANTHKELRCFRDFAFRIILSNLK